MTPLAQEESACEDSGNCKWSGLSYVPHSVTPPACCVVQDAAV